MTLGNLLTWLRDPEDPFVRRSARGVAWWRQPSLLGAVGVVVTALLLAASVSDDAWLTIIALLPLLTTIGVFRFGGTPGWSPEQLQELWLTQLDRERVAAGALRAPLRAWAGAAAAVLATVVTQASLRSWSLPDRGDILMLAAMAALWVLALAAVIPVWLARPSGLRGFVLTAPIAFLANFFLFAGVLLAAMCIADVEPGNDHVPFWVLLWLLGLIVGVCVALLARALRHAGARLFACVDDGPLSLVSAVASRDRLRREAEEGGAPIPSRTRPGLPAAIVGAVVADAFNVALAAAVQLYRLTPTAGWIPLPGLLPEAEPNRWRQFDPAELLIHGFLSPGALISFALVSTVVCFAVEQRRRWREVAVHGHQEMTDLGDGLIRPVAAIFAIRWALALVAIANSGVLDRALVAATLPVGLMAAGTAAAALTPRRGRTRHAIGIFAVGAAHILYVSGLSSPGWGGLIFVTGRPEVFMMGLAIFGLLQTGLCTMLDSRWLSRFHREDLMGLPPVTEPETRSVSPARLALLMQDRENPFIRWPAAMQRRGSGFIALLLLLLQGIAIVLTLGLAQAFRSSDAALAMALAWTVTAPATAVGAFVFTGPRRLTSERLQELLLTRLRREECLAGALRRPLLVCAIGALLWAAAALAGGWLLANHPTVGLPETFVIGFPFMALLAFVLAAACVLQNWLTDPARLPAVVVFSSLEFVAWLGLGIMVTFLLFAAGRGLDRHADTPGDAMLVLLPVLGIIAWNRMRKALRAADVRLFARVDAEALAERDWFAWHGLRPVSLLQGFRGSRWTWRPALAGWLATMGLLVVAYLIVVYLLPLGLGIRSLLFSDPWSSAGAWRYWERWRAQLPPWPVQIFSVSSLAAMGIILPVLMFWLGSGRRWDGQLVADRTEIIPAFLRHFIPVAVVLVMHAVICTAVQALRSPGTGGLVLAAAPIGKVAAALLPAFVSTLILLPRRGRWAAARVDLGLGLIFIAASVASGTTEILSEDLTITPFQAAAPVWFGLAVLWRVPSAMQQLHEELAPELRQNA